MAYTSGTLAIIGSDRNIYLTQIDAEPIQITDDSSQAIFYSHPTWSTEGWLSFLKSEAADNGQSYELLALSPDRQDLQSIATPETPYIYGNWSPVECGQDSDCTQLAYLLAEEDAISLNLSPLTGDTGEGDTSIELDQASPYYYSWAPDGKRMVWVQNAEEIIIYDVEQLQEIEKLTDTAGSFQAPAWSPTSEQFLYVRRNDNGENQLVLRANDDTRAIGRPTQSRILFSWSPDGSLIARWAIYNNTPELIITDVDTEDTLVSLEIENIAAFFWSPDSQHIAFVTIEPPEPEFDQAQTGVLARPLRQPPHVVMVWYLLNVESGEQSRLVEFVPTFEQNYLFQYFEQYAQSHSIWSPDSRYIVYAQEVFGESESEIILLDTTETSILPETIMEGDFAVFSFR